MIRRAWLIVLMLGASSLATAKPRPKPDATPSASQQAELDKLVKEFNTLVPGRDAAKQVVVARKLYALQSKATGPDSELAHRYREWLVRALEDARQLVEAEGIELQIIASITKAKGASAKDLVEPLDRLANIYFGLQRFAEYDKTMERIVAIAKQAYGEKSEDYARRLQFYAGMLDARSEYGSAQRLYEQSLAIFDALPKGAHDRMIAGNLMFLGHNYMRTNQHAKAVAAFDRAVSVTLAAKDITALERITASWQPAVMYTLGGRKDLADPQFAKAIALAKREIATAEKSPPDVNLAYLYGALGFTYWYSGDLKNADAAYQRALDISAKLKQPTGIEGTAAELRRTQGRNKDALALLEKARRDMPQPASFYDLMSAEILSEMRDHKRATALVDKYLAEVAKAYGKQATYGYGAMRAVEIHARAGDLKKAERLLDDALGLAEKELTRAMSIGTDSDHVAYFAQNRDVLDHAITFNVASAPTSATATRLGLTTLLRRKGRILDASAAALATIRSKLSPADRKLLDELTSARAQLAKLAVAGGTQNAKDIAALEETIQRLEGEVSKKSAAYKTTVQRIELAAIQKLIPKDARLVEIANYEPKPLDRTHAQIAAQPHLPRRYAAYIVGPKGDPVVVELGDAAPIEAAVAKLRKALADPDNDQAADLAHQLHALTTAKILPKLGGATNVLIAPDGALNVVPFSALVDDKRKFLIATYTFNYLTSGRDLLRLVVKTKAQGGGVMFADPAFDATAPAKGGTSRGRRSADLAGLRWPQLPGTAAEADAIAKSFKGLKVVRGAAATEAAVKQVASPQILHLATHGFFLADERDDAGAGKPAAAVAAAPAENPLLRSGLALSGANKLSSGDDDGLLTALEASGLDLWGTKLVVLSACETGVGKVTNGDGVYGLRRALVIAGAESLVMSMWQVDDFATKELMAGFYKKLAAGAPRGAALRETQLELLSKPKYAHPFYWAAFVPAGATTPLKD
jgi:CHAT domain-containing protein